MMEQKDDSRIQMIQFHQSYSYKDFIEGFRSKVNGDGFELKQGPFIKFSRKAARDPERDYFIFIDIKPTKLIQLQTARKAGNT